MPNFSKTMPLVVKPILLITLLGLSGCASLNSSEKDFRDTEATMAKDLAMPPRLISPAQVNHDFYTAIASTEGQVKTTQIPSYQAQGLQVKSNLSERWLEIESVNSQEVWLGVQNFLASLGMSVKEARKDIGIIKTEFTPRKELVPLGNIGALTKLFNVWRDEHAVGAYDRLIARVETDLDDNKVRVYFHHYVIFADTDKDGNRILGNARIRPYDPMFEAKTLYQAMIFFGATQANALQQIEMAEYRMEMVEGTAFAGIKMRAGLNESWSYLQSMLHRADWRLDKVVIQNYQAWVKVPDDARTEIGLLSKLAFWRVEDERNIPEIVRFTVKVAKDDSGNPLVPTVTILTVSSLDGEAPLDEKNREYIFNQLGFTAQ